VRHPDGEASVAATGIPTLRYLNAWSPRWTRRCCFCSIASAWVGMNRGH